MFKTYLKFAFRNLVKKKFISFTNIIGLSCGMAVFILISLWIWNELTFDRYHDHYHRIAKVRLNITSNGEIQTSKTVPLPLADELRANYHNDFKYVVTSSHRLNHVLASGEKKLLRKGVYLSAEAPEMLSLKMVKGDVSGLSDRHSILLSASTAKAFFGDADPMNKVMTIDKEQSVKVTGVFENLPDNTTFGDLAFIAPFDLYISHQKWITNISTPWSRNPIQLYIQLAETADIDQVAARIKNIVRAKAGEDDAGRKSAVILEPMSKWHLYAFKDGQNTTGSIRYVKMFALIGVFVLLLACFNFMNLSTARSEKRAREVGIRKAIGSLRSQLTKQFFVESILLSLLAFAFAVMLAQLALPFFNEIAGETLVILWNNVYFWMFGVLFSVITGLLAGIYPAVYLSSFHPVKVLKGSFRIGGNASTVRKALVVLQFTVSIILVICTIVIFRQIEHAKERAIGYDPDNLVLIPTITDDVPSHFDAVKNELLKTGAVAAMAASESTTTDIWGTDSDLDWKGKDPNITVDFPNTGVSVDYGKTVGWQFIGGRDFSRQFATDSTAFILNEAAVKFMGLENAVGEVVRWKGKPFTVIGVIKDMVVESPYDPVRPSIYCLARGHDNFAIVKLNAAINTATALQQIETVFRKYSPSAPFEFEFINKRYDRKFTSEKQVGKLAGFFTLLAVFISCLGVFAMALFMAEQRSREIGVRKVFGASVFSVWRLLSKEFTQLIFVSWMIALPVGYYVMFNWLESYHYRTNISWWILAVAAMGALLVTLATVSFQSIKAALANPVKSLRNE